MAVAGPTVFQSGYILLSFLLLRRGSRTGECQEFCSHVFAENHHYHEKEELEVPSLVAEWGGPKAGVWWGEDRWQGVMGSGLKIGPLCRGKISLIQSLFSFMISVFPSEEVTGNQRKKLRSRVVKTLALLPPPVND